MRDITLEEVKAKSDAIKTEIRNRLRCGLGDFEIKRHLTGKITIFWEAIDIRYAIIPANWIVFCVDYKANRISMCADPSEFKVFNSND